METVEKIQIKNPIVRLLEGLPAKVSENMKAVLRDYSRNNFYRNWLNPDYDIKKVSVEDMLKLKEVLEVTDDFFMGDNVKVETQLKEVLKKHQTLVAA